MRSCHSHKSLIGSSISITVNLINFKYSARNFAACQLFIACVLLDEGLNMNKIIEVKHLKKNYGDKEVLKDINAVIEKGKVITVIGPSGSGKSTFLRCLNLLDQ